MEIKNAQFISNGEPVKIISGSIHYFRSHHQTWEEKIIKLSNLGCNCVETYVPWNLHEPFEGVYDFTNNLNLEKFIEICEKYNLYIILRFPPYICAEHDFGGLPWWILTKKDIRIRCNNKQYLQAVENYTEKLFEIVLKYTANNGGKIIMGQVENEYGSYGNDKEYLKVLVNIYRKLGFQQLLATSDGTWDQMLECGNLSKEGVIPTVNFGSNAEAHFKYLKENVDGEYPLMCMEFWCGWFDAWGQKWSDKSNPEQAALQLDKVLKRGSCNIYMFHGGTNFGFNNGANLFSTTDYQPHTSTYDYDALLDERGNITDKYNECKKIIQKYNTNDYIDVPEREIMNYENINYVGSYDVLSRLKNPRYDINTLTIEQLNQGFGYAIYESSFKNINHINKIQLVGLRDRANIYIDDIYITTIDGYKDDGKANLNVDVCEDSKIKILVENFGRVNYGAKLADGQKGIIDGVFIDSHYHFGWNHYCVQMEESHIKSLTFRNEKRKAVQYHQYELYISEQPLDTYLDMKNFGKGVVFINGFNIGRYWQEGPQTKLYVPSPLLKSGTNSITIFESEGITGELMTSIENK